MPSGVEEEDDRAGGVSGLRERYGWNFLMLEVMRGGESGFGVGGVESYLKVM